MERLYTNEKQLEKLPLYYQNKTSEATILDFSKTEILKHFHWINENKVYTLEEINHQEEDLRLVKELLIFKKIVLVNSQVKGILIDKGYNANLADFKMEKVSFNDLIMVLQNIGRVLHTLHCCREQEGILKTFFIGDLHEGNILVDRKTKNIQICDIDSCKIGSNQPFPTKYLNFYNKYNYVRKNLKNKYPIQNDRFIPNGNSDLYCYIKIILDILFNFDIEYLNILNYHKVIYNLKEQGLPDALYQIFINLYHPIDNKNPYKYLDSIPSSFERKLKL